MRGGWGEAEIVWFESGCVICRAADHAEAIGHRPQAIPVDGMFSRPPTVHVIVNFSWAGRVPEVPGPRRVNLAQTLRQPRVKSQRQRQEQLGLLRGANHDRTEPRYTLKRRRSAVLYLICHQRDLV